MAPQTFVKRTQRKPRFRKNILCALKASGFEIHESGDYSPLKNLIISIYNSVLHFLD